MRNLLLAALLLVGFALTGCCTKTDATTKASPKKKMAILACPAIGPCVAQQEAGK
jgi:hypothetical protein